MQFSEYDTLCVCVCAVNRAILSWASLFSVLLYAEFLDVCIRSSSIALPSTQNSHGYAECRRVVAFCKFIYIFFFLLAPRLTHSLTVYLLVPCLLCYIFCSVGWLLFFIAFLYWFGFPCDFIATWMSIMLLLFCVCTREEQTQIGIDLVCSKLKRYVRLLEHARCSTTNGIWLSK